MNNHLDRGSYKKNESFLSSFSHSCLGKIIILAVILVILLFLAWISVPGKTTMTEEIEDDIRECIMSHDSIQGDWIDDAVNNVGHIVTHADSTFESDKWETFLKFNRLEYHRHPFYATVHVHNNLRPEGQRIGIGIWGIVIPTVTYSDLLLRTGVMHKGYEQKIYQSISGSEEYFGSNPNVNEYHYKGEATQ
jgi:hypothetical protein